MLITPLLSVTFALKNARWRMAAYSRSADLLIVDVGYHMTDLVMKKAVPPTPYRLSLYSRLMNNDNFAGYLLVAPLIIGLLLFNLYPVLYSFYLSFTKGTFGGPPKWVGLENYRTLVDDPIFWKSLWNTLYYTVGVIPLSVVLAIALALAMNQKLRGITVFRAIFFLPIITSSVAVSIMWLWIYNPQFGILNYLLSQIGITGIKWLAVPETAMLSIIIMAIWRGLGYNMLLFLAGLQNIPDTLYEAAKIDGAGNWAQFRYVTLPLLTPTTFFVVVLMFIGGFQVFEYTYVMTNGAGGPVNSTMTVVLYLYREGFTYFRLGYASAIAYILALMIFAVTAIQFRMQRHWVNYD
jgi:multiple sugar transport system permease protein